MKIFSEVITSFVSPANGSSPMWSFGSPVIIRNGDYLYASVMETDPEAIPLDNTVLTLYQKYQDEPWELVFRDSFLQREPCPLAVLPGQLIISTNPSLRPKKLSGAHDYRNHSRPALYFFDISGGTPQDPATVITRWDDAVYEFSSHTYRALAVDSVNQEILLMNQCYTRKADWEHCWSLLGADGKYINGGIINYPVRSCYQSAALKNNAAHAFAVSDIIEPNEEWRRYKKEKSGNDWDYDFRNLYYSYASDIRRGNFGDPVLIASAEDTCGYARPLDIYIDDSGDAHLLYYIRNVWHTYMRDKFFPDLKLCSSLGYCRMSDNKIIEQYDIVNSSEAEQGQIGDFNGFFHVSADKKLHILYRKRNVRDSGWYIAEPMISTGAINIPDLGLEQCFNVKPRMGAEPSDCIDIYGTSGNEIKYVRLLI